MKVLENKAESAGNHHFPHNVFYPIKYIKLSFELQLKLLSATFSNLDQPEISSSGRLTTCKGNPSTIKSFFIIL